MHVMSLGTELFQMAVSHYTRIFDPGVDGIQLNKDLVTQTMKLLHAQ